MARGTRLDDEKWAARAAYLERFVLSRRRLPDYSDGEIGAWLSTQRSGLNKGLAWMTPERQEVLDRIAPGWREPLPPVGEPWGVRAEEVRRFHAVMGHWPRQQAEDDEERSLGTWLSNQRHKAKRGELDPRREAALDRHLPGWRGRGLRDATWLANADALGAFHRERGRWPSGSSKDEAERKLGIWLSNRRQDARTGTGWSEERAGYLDQVAPGWGG